MRTAALSRIPGLKSLDEMARYRLFLTTLRVAQLAARPTASKRSLPNFLIVGAQRAGTTTLYRLLQQHPDVAFPRLTKGAHYFDTNYEKSLAWYRSNFQLADSGPNLIGEACPYYGFHPFAPARIAEVIPQAKLVMVLRDPVERAWSQYHHERARGFEYLTSFGAALEAEDARLKDATLTLAGRPGLHLAHQHQSYVSRGQYATQIQRCWSAVGADRTLILFTADLEQRPQQTVERLHEFLDLPPHRTEVGRWNPRSSGTIPSAAIESIRAKTADSDAWLARNLPVAPPWVR